MQNKKLRLGLRKTAPSQSLDLLLEQQLHQVREWVMQEQLFLEAKVLLKKSSPHSKLQELPVQETRVSWDKFFLQA